MLDQFACDIDFQDDRDCVPSLGKWVYCLLIVLCVPIFPYLFFFVVFF